MPVITRSAAKSILQMDPSPITTPVVLIKELPPPPGRAKQELPNSEEQFPENNLEPIRDSMLFKPPPPFRGIPGEDFREWLKRFNRWALCCHYSQLRKCEILPVLLEGRAENVYDALPIQARGDFDALSKTLLERLQPPRLSDLKSVVLHAREQRSGEAVIDFARDIQKLTRQAYPNVDTSGQDQIMKRIFLNGLLPALRTFVMYSDPETFDDAVTAAQRQEAQQQFNEMRAEQVDKQTAEITNKILNRFSKFTVTPEGHNFGINYRNPTRQQGSRQQNYRTAPPFSQSNQQRLGHGNAYQAPKRFPNQPQRLRWSERGEPICWRCRKPGHRQSQCPEGTQSQGHRKPSPRRVMTIRRINDENFNFSKAEITQLIHENEILQKQNERLVEQLYPKRAAAVISVTPVSQKYPWKIPLFFFCILAFLTPIYAHTFFLCGASSHGFALVAPKEVHCIPPTLGAISNYPVELWVPRNDPIKLAAIKCQIHVRTVCTHTGFFGSKGIVSDSKDLRTVTTNNCREAANHKRWNNKELTQLSPRLWALKDDFDIAYKWCCRDYCFEHQTFILEIGEIASMDSEHVISDLGDLGGCHAKAGVCDNHEATIMWDNTIFLSSICPYIYKARYNAEISNNFVLIDEIQGAFSINKSRPVPSCVPSRAYMTDQGIIIRLDKTNKEETTTEPQNRKIRQLDTEANQIYSNSSQRPIIRLPQTTKQLLTVTQPSLTTKLPTMRNNAIPLETDPDPVNAKLLYLEKRLLEIEQKNFKQVWNVLCHMANRQLNLINQFLRIDPTLGARTLLDRTDIHATFAGEALMIWQCHEIKPDQIFWNYRFKNICYTYVPVIKNGTLYFLVPGSTDLVLQAPQIPCEHHFSGIYYNGSTWVTTNGKVHVTPVPMDLSFKKQWKSFTFSSPALFHSKLAGLANELEYLRSYSSRIQELQSQMNRIINYTAELSLDPHVVSAALKGIGDGIGNIIVAEGTAVGTIFQGIGRGTAQLLDSILKGPVQVIVNAIVFAIVLIATGFLLYKFGGPKLIEKCRKKRRNPTITEAPPAREEIIHSEEPPPTQNTIIKRKTREEFNRFVYSLTSSSAPFIEIQLNGISTQALWDTGADLTMISSKLYEQLKQHSHMRSVKSPPPIVQSMTGEAVKLKQAIPLTFNIANQQIQHTTWIADTMTPHCIIGTDLQQKCGPFTMDHKKGSLTFHKTNQVDAEAVTLIEQTVIPARSECNVWGKLEFTLEDAAEFEPHEQLYERYRLNCAHAIVAANCNEIPVRLLNLNNTDVQLYAGTKLGFVSVKKIITEKLIARVAVVNNSPRSIREIIDTKQFDLEENQTKQLLNLLDEYDDIFAKSDYDIGRTKLVRHPIETTTTKPIYQRPYRLPASRKEFVETSIDEMLRHNLIRPSQSPWASPVVIVPKKNGKLRFAVDYRKLNAVTKRDVFPLPRIDEILDSLGDAQYFTTLDMCAGYWQIEVEPKDREKTAFITHSGLYEFNVMPFGLTNAPATFQRMVNLLLSGLNWKSCMAYLDDVIVFSKTFQQHLSDLREIFDRLREQNLKLSPTKCKFFRQEVTFLGHVVDKNGIRPDPDKTKAVANYPQPVNVSELRSFLGLVSYYRNFIENFAKIAQPLVNLLKKDKPFVWAKEQEEAFMQLRKLLCEAPVLAYPDFSKEFILQTDASGYALGAVLSQIFEEKERPIAYASRTLRQGEKNFSTIEKECLAIIFAIKHFHCYLFGRKFKLITDHAPLRWLMNMKEPTGRLARWSLALQQYDFDIYHKPGVTHKNADALSRIVATASFNSYSWYKTSVTEEEFKRLQSEDPELGPILQFLKSHKLPEGEEKARHIAIQSETYFLHQDILYHMANNLKQQRFRVPQLAIPNNLRKGIMQQCHENPTAGHLGPSKTLSKISTYYYWPSIYKDVLNFCRTCIKCQQGKRPPRYNKEPLQNLPITNRPFEMVAVDVLGPLPQTFQGNRYIIIYMDYFSKWPEATATSDQKADTTARTFIQDIICRHGCPTKLLSDRGKNFMSELMQSVCATLGVKKIQTSPYHPQSDGMVEKFNSTILKILSMYCEKNQRDWDEYLSLALFAYRTATHESTGESPFYLLYGRDAILPVNLHYNIPTTYADERAYKEVLTERLQDAWKLTRINIQKAQEHQKSSYDKSVIASDFHIGDQVLIHTPRPKKGRSPKLTHCWMGPYHIIDIHSPTVTVVPADKPNNTPQIIHMNRLKPFFSPKRNEKNQSHGKREDKSSTQQQPPMPETNNEEASNKQLHSTTNAQKQNNIEKRNKNGFHRYHLRSRKRKDIID